MLEPIPTQEKYEVKIADLGSSKILFTKTPDTRRTHVVGTPHYAPDYVQDILNTKKTISLSRLKKWFPNWDLFCLGATLAKIVWAHPNNRPHRNFDKWLNDPRENVARIFGKDLELLKRIILQLVAEPEECFSDVGSVAEAFRKFLPEYLVPLGVREMAVGGAHRTITQPREKVYLSERLYDLVEHPTFQRLHNQSQLNFVYMLYPGGKHSRFLHSLTTYEMTKRYIEGLLGDSYFKYLMDKQDFETLLVAAMLHDVGQYPLAHAIEDLGDESFMGFESGVKPDYQMSEYFLKKRKGRKRESIADLLERSRWVDVDRLIRLLSRKKLTTEADHFIHSMLDGPLDVDKVSYLLYDSYFTGARYGLGVDLDGFLSSLVAVPQMKGRHSQMGILSTGVVAAEGVISARYSMFSRVYWHHFNRAVMAMLKYATAKIFLSRRGVTFEQYIQETFSYSDIDALRYLHHRLRRVLRRGESNPLTGLLDGSRRVHRRFLTFSGHQGSDTAAIYNRLGRYSFKTLERKRLIILKKLSVALGERLEDSDVLFDVPKSEKTSDTLNDLYVYDPDSVTEPYKALSTLSGVARALCDEFESHTKKCRILVSARLGEKMEQDITKARRAREKIEDYLAGIA
jgi:HD superfamily phosphohydrolase